MTNDELRINTQSAGVVSFVILHSSIVRLRSHALRELYAYFVHPPPVGIEYLDVDPFAVEFLSRRRHSAQIGFDQSGDRGAVHCFKLLAGKFFKAMQLRASAEDVAARAFFDYLADHCLIFI